VDAALALERATEHAPHWSRAAYAEMIEAGSATARRRLIVAESAETSTRRIAGFAAGAIARGGSAELESVAVAEGARRGGIGRALCEAVIVWCREEGATEVVLEVRATSAAATALYARLGFVEIARRPRYYRDPEDDAVVMRLAL